MSISGHTHYQEHRFITREDGWRGAEPHHHVVSVTVSGSWWSGAPDENGVPHTTMRDGAPNGYTIITFDGTKAAVDFKAARRPADYQMTIHTPERVRRAALAETAMYANVFGGSERTTVEFAFDRDGPWTLMQQVREPDPYFARMKQMENDYPLPGRKLPAIIPSPHLWKAALPGTAGAGTQTIFVRATLHDGRRVYGERVITIVE
jgi:hypothetical protein